MNVYEFESGKSLNNVASEYLNELVKVGKLRADRATELALFLFGSDDKKNAFHLGMMAGLFALESGLLKVQKPVMPVEATGDDSFDVVEPVKPVRKTVRRA